jgi:hypothetical protein
LYAIFGYNLFSWSCPSSWSWSICMDNGVSWFINIGRWWGNPWRCSSWELSPGFSVSVWKSSWEIGNPSIEWCFPWACSKAWSSIIWSC